ncbi:unnamed protein product [Prunus brigantina]
MNMECTRVAIRTGFSKSDAEQKYEKTHEGKPLFILLTSNLLDSVLKTAMDCDLKPVKVCIEIQFPLVPH